MFLNSKIWRELQRNVGREVFEVSTDLEMADRDVHLIKMDLPFGKNYLYSPSTRAIEYLNEIKKIGRGEGSIFFKYEPLIIEHTTWNTEHLKSLGLQKAVKPLQPQRTIILDLTKDYDELLKQMHQKTRYNIKLAQRHKVDVRESKDIEIFWGLMQKTRERDKFSLHSKEYYQKLLELEGVRLFIAYYKEQPAASAIVIFHRERATYLHGASDYSLRKYMAPYALHQEIILVAQCEDMEKYDFWGINEKKWPGVTRFKRGFGGKEVGYIGSYDLVFRPVWYKLYDWKNRIK